MAEYIERDIAKNAIGAIMPSMSTLDGRGEYDHLVLAAQEMCVDAITAIREIPAADVAPVVHSRWEECDYVEPCVHGFGTNRIKNAGMKCLNCVHVFKKDLLWKDNFCPNCGAKMSGENNAID